MYRILRSLYNTEGLQQFPNLELVIGSTSRECLEKYISYPSSLTHDGDWGRKRERVMDYPSDSSNHLSLPYLNTSI